MTLDEKLDVFYNAAIEDATKQSQQIIDEYQQTLQANYIEYKKEQEEKVAVTLRIETNNLICQKNKKLSAEATILKKNYTTKIIELKNLLFHEIEEEVKKYMTTKKYIELLKNQIEIAVITAKGDSLIIYINSSDKDKKELLEQATGSEITISTINFIGGTRAIIHSKNILIDNSFSTRLAEQKELFTFN